MQRLRRPLLTVLVAVVSMLMSAADLAAESVSDPYAALRAMPANDLASLNGREAVLAANQNQEAHTNGVVTAGGDVQGGNIDLGSSFQSMHGVSNQVFTTGNLSSAQGSLIINVYTH